MEIQLTPELEALIHADVASGRYASVDEYIAEAVELLHERAHSEEEMSDRELARLDESFTQAERGELIDEDEVRRRIQSRRAEWAARQLVG